MDMVARVTLGLLGLALTACEAKVEPAPGSRPANGGSSSPGGGGNSEVMLPPASVGMTPPPTSGAGTPSEQTNCGISRIPLYSKPGQLLLVLDRSGSMAEQVGPAMPVEKWGEVVSALDAVLQKTEATLPWGLKLYPEGSLCGVPAGLTVPVGPNNRSTILTAINDNRPYIDGGATPTRAAVLAAVASLQTAPGMSPNLLIATDGIPNCTTDTAGNPPDPDSAVDAIKQAAAAGIPSFVVGIATADTDANETLNRMAEAGGRARGGAVKYYPVSGRDELVQAFTTISSDIASCRFPLATPPPVPDNVAVEVGGERIPTATVGGSSGWSYGPNRDAIVLTGAACEAVKRGSTDVKIIYGCPNQVIQ